MFPPLPLQDTPRSDYIGIITLPTHQEERHREQKRKHRTVHRQPSIMPPFPPCCGLIIVASRQPVPLQGIWVDVQVKGFVADVSATLKYKNKEEKAVEAVFVFPMDEDSAVYSFEATIEGKKIVADLQEKKEAHKTYDEAISRGEQAFLLEEDESSADIFSCSVGNLPPGQEAEVTLKYVRELPVEADGAVRFVLPAILNPRYTPKDYDVSITATRPQVPIGEIQYTLSLNAHFQSTYGIAKIESKCNITPLEYTDSDKTSAKVSLAEGHKFDRDVELLAYYMDVNKPSVTVEAGLGATDAAQESGPRPSGSIMAESMAMLNFYPSFPAGQEQSNCGEFIFLVDRSGSMECSMNSEPNAPQRIHSARETLVLLLKSLPLGCYFNIYGFGSRFEAFFLESVEYTQQTMEEAVKKVNEMDASFGGTEILQPLKKIYETAGRAEHPRQLFVFTDGEVGNTKQVIDEVQKNAQKHRCLTFGIGEGASTSLIKGMARAGSGIFEFITGKDRMQPKVLRALKCSLQPTVKDISLTWTLPSGVEATVLSKVPTAIFQGQRSIVYAQLKGKVCEPREVENEADGEVCLQYKFKDEMIKNNLRFPLNVQNVERPTIHRLASKALISELEQGTESQSEDVKKKILETSLQSGVVSSLTAYVAVNKDTKTRVEGPPMRRDVPAPALMIRHPACHVGYLSCSVSIPKSKKRKTIALSSGRPPAMFRSANEERAVRDSLELCLPPAVPETPALVRLISLQNADGSWNLTPQISAVLGISETDIKTGNPDQNVEVSVWVTVLAVIWLHTTCVDQREEWELLEGKAVSWVRVKAGSSLGEFVRVGNKLLKSSVDPKVFGL
ncbi:von Willebrand factor A domain-containing protein 5A-like isoform X1 [Lithobates pipiens]